MRVIWINVDGNLDTWDADCCVRIVTDRASLIAYREPRLVLSEANFDDPDVAVRVLEEIVKREASDEAAVLDVRVFLDELSIE